MRRATTFPREMDIRHGDHLLLHVVARPRDGAQVALPLTGLVKEGSLTPVALESCHDSRRSGTFFYVTVDEVPLERPRHPDSRGLSVERWYERYSDALPIRCRPQPETWYASVSESLC